MAQKVAYRFLYVVIFTLFVLTAYFFILDLQSQGGAIKPAGIVDPDFRSNNNNNNIQQRKEPEWEEQNSREKMINKKKMRKEELRQRQAQTEADFGIQKTTTSSTTTTRSTSAACYDSKAYRVVDTAVSHVKRYIESYTYDEPYEHFHPKDEYLVEAESLLAEGLGLCDWDSCSSLCVNTTIYSALLSLKADRSYEAANMLDVGISFADTAEERGRLMVFRGFTAEYADQLNVRGYQFYTQAVREWPEAALEYMAVIRYDLPDDAPKEEKMKIYYYGKREEIIALVDGLLAKEFHPENLQNYPILRPDEPDLFWNPQGEKQYKLIKQLMSPFIQTVNAKMMASLIDNGHLDFKDPQATRFFAYNERFSRFFQFNSVGVIRKILGREVIISYTYFGGYVGGSTLSPHRDRPACEYTMSLVIDSYPHGSTWPLAINKVSKAGMTPTEPGGPGIIPSEDKIVRAMLQPGDSFIFQGRHKVHWRDGALEDGHMTRVYFYHYVNEDYVGSLT